MAEGQTYNIPEARLKWFREKIEKLNKKSMKLVNEPVFCTVLGYHLQESGDGPKKLNQTKIFEVFVAHPEVKLSGWEFIARIDHSQELGNVVRVVPGKELPERYRDTGSICEHCNINRKRRDTFVLHCEESDQSKQVGSSCLKDFLGHDDAVKLSKLAELLAVIGDYARGYGWQNNNGWQGNSSLIDRRWISLDYYVGLVADSILNNGWISGKQAKEREITSTANLALKAASDDKDVSAIGAELAERAVEWASCFGDDGRDLNDWEHNARVIAQSEALEMRHLAIAASIIGVYWVKFEQQTPKAQKVSNYVGVVGDKITAQVVVKVVSYNQFSNRHVFEDAQGNVFVWFASGDDLSEHKDKEITIRGTVKAQNEYKNTKQTIINRVKVV